ncbi:MAG: FadR/GntR family transcriptional regulator [Dongiaceae bacterium]
MARIGARGGTTRGSPGLALAATSENIAPLRIVSDPMRGSSWITGQLRKAIHDGAYAHGEKLPAERQLADAFGTSRTTVRMALDQLEQERLVTRRVGAGTFVNYRAAAKDDDVTELTSPLELIEVRLALEPHMTRLACVNATARDIDRLSEVMGRIGSICADSEGFTQWDEEFHLAIAECTRNPLLVSLYRQINDVRTHKQWNAMKDKVLTAERIADYNQQHRSLFEAIRSRDVEGAVAIITAHLHQARRQLMGAGSE